MGSIGLVAEQTIVLVEDKPDDFAQFTEAVRQLGIYWLVVNQRPTGPAPQG